MSTDGRTDCLVGRTRRKLTVVFLDGREGRKFVKLSLSRAFLFSDTVGWMETEESWRIVSADVNKKFGFIVARRCRRWRLKSGTLAISYSVSTEVMKVGAIVIPHRRRRYWTEEWSNGRCPSSSLEGGRSEERSRFLCEESSSRSLSDSASSEANKGGAIHLVGRHPPANAAVRESTKCTFRQMAANPRNPLLMKHLCNL